MVSILNNVLSILLISCTLYPSHAELDLIRTSSRLPYPRWDHTAVYDGLDSIYIIGGNGDRRDAIYKYTLGTGAVEFFGTFENLIYGWAVMSGDDILYFGGARELGVLSSRVYSFSTLNRTYDVVAELPLAVRSHKIAWNSNQRAAYLVGGLANGNIPYDQIIRFDTKSLNITHVGTLPQGRWNAATVWDPHKEVAYIFGGYGDFKDVLQFDPLTGLTTLPAELPDILVFPDAVFADVSGEAYIINYYNLTKFNAATQRIENPGVNGWPDKLTSAAGVYVPKLNRIYVIGGITADRNLDDISYVALSRTHPTTETTEITTIKHEPGIDLRFVVANSTLPTGLMGHSVVYDGEDSIYIVGGWNGSHFQDKVLKYSLGSGVVAVFGTFFGVADGASYFNGDQIVYFGGSRSSGIYSFSTRTGTVHPIGEFPFHVDGMALAWDPKLQLAYLFGGLARDGTMILSDIVRFNSTSQDLDKVSELAQKNRGSSAAWNDLDGVAYVFGGSYAEYDITLYHPRYNFSRFITKTPWPIVCAAFIQDVAYIVTTLDLVRFDSVTERVESLGVKDWPESSAFTSESKCVYVPKLERLYIIGGSSYDGNYYYSERIAFVDMGADTPTTTEADQGSTSAELVTSISTTTDQATPDSTSDQATPDSTTNQETPDSTTDQATSDSVTSGSTSENTETTEASSVVDVSFPTKLSTSTSVESSTPTVVVTRDDSLSTESLLHSSTERTQDEPGRLMILLAIGIPVALAVVVCVGLIYTFRRQTNFAQLCIVKTFSRVHRKTKKNDAFSVAEIQEFEEGVPESRDQTPIDDTYISRKNVIYHKYNRLFEVDLNRYHIYRSQHLGSGQFGLVLQGTEVTSGVKVAVKTVQPNCTSKRNLSALLSELKILIYVGRHVNIVNLIGACTAELRNGVVFLFLEYCELGDLENYLRVKKDLFFGCDHKTPKPQSQGSSYCKLWDIDSICPCDLIRWSVQTVSGMEFLASRRVVHGDLAARNILLASKQCVKITDFGLSKQLYQYTECTKADDNPVPWRSMAPESLLEMKFSAQSDVWSLGVTIWEIFSLGEIPYTAGINFSLDFVTSLQNGLRLQPPERSPIQVYKEMLRCWQVRPEERPTFTEIKEALQAIGTDLEREAR